MKKNVKNERFFMKQRFLAATAILIAAQAYAAPATGPGAAPAATGPGVGAATRSLSPNVGTSPAGTSPSVNSPITTPSTAPTTTTTPSTSSPSNFDVVPPPVMPNDPINDRFTIPRNSSGISTIPPLPSGTDPLRSRSAFPTSRDWENNVGGAANSDIGTDAGRLTPPPDINVRPRPLTGTGSATMTTPSDVIRGTSPNTGLNATSPTIGTATTSPVTGLNATSPVAGSELNTTGTPATGGLDRQPLDRAMTAKIRSQLSVSPKPGATAISPELINGLRISSQNGRVVIEGNVPNEAMRDSIMRRAGEVQGTGGIIDRMTVANSAVGAPGSTQSGQSPQNQDDLNDNHPQISPDK